MKNLSLLFLLAITALLTYSFTLKKKTVVHSLNKIEKNWGMVTPNLFASKFETTNKEYQIFLNSVQSKMTEKEREQLTIKIKNWLKISSKNEPMVNLYHQHPAYADYPLVNVTHQGAKAYCEWLTNLYNDRSSKKYKKVLFRLPTEAEWKTAAKAGRDAPFPWGGYYMRNAKGCKLANYKSIPETAIKNNPQTGKLEIIESFGDDRPLADLNDESVFPAPVYSYFPNDFGLYNMSGNVSEMVAEPNRFKGGSWASTAYYLQIDAEEEFLDQAEARPQVGFRYFVEILEE
ncbi:MAG: SUMF1/EgtB/PvdO family nonheme iron enzyme [Bacteroidota bacterium]